MNNSDSDTNLTISKKSGIYKKMINLLKNEFDINHKSVKILAFL